MYNFHKTYIKACNSKIKGQLYELRGLQEARERSRTPGILPVLLRWGARGAMGTQKGECGAGVLVGVRIRPVGK